MKRRNFIRTTAAAGATFTVLPHRVWAGTKSNSTLQLAQIGCGRQGRGDMKNALANGWKDEFNARVVAVCDVDSWRSKEAKTTVENFYQERDEAKVEVNVYEDYEDVLAREDIDGVIISTCEHWHGLIGVAAANAGKHIYLQKPLTYTIAEGQALVKAVRNNNVVLQTGSQQRSSTHFRQVCTIIRNNWLGKLKEIEVGVPTDRGEAQGEPTDPPATLNYDKWLGPCESVPYIESRVHGQKRFDRPGWLQVERHCLGMITGWGSHMYDIAQWGNGTDADSGPVEISAKGEFPDRGHFNVHVNFKGESTYANGVRMTSNNGKAGVKFITEDGWAYCARGKMDCSNKEFLRRKPAENETSLYTSKSHMGDFLGSAREGKDPICPVEVGHRSNSICVLHHISMKLGGRKIKWDPVNEKILDDSEASEKLSVPFRPPYTMG
ncbi:MAG: Gfo/Idh/MocA family oxidoreductase [Verrucomicrobiota bacterium]